MTRDFKTSKSVFKKLLRMHYKYQNTDGVNNSEGLSWREFRLVDSLKTCLWNFATTVYKRNFVVINTINCAP